jgi:hypothetical protein
MDRGVKKFLGETVNTEALDFIVVIIVKFEPFDFVFWATDLDKAVGYDV